MASLTANDYYARGVQAGLECPVDQKPYMPLKPGIWQAKAWERGCEAGLRERDQRGAQHVEHEKRQAELARIVAAHKSWPGAALAHFNCLIRDISQERNPKRVQRLHRAIFRMYERHEKQSLKGRRA